MECAFYRVFFLCCLPGFGGGSVSLSDFRRLVFFFVSFEAALNPVPPSWRIPASLSWFCFFFGFQDFLFGFIELKVEWNSFEPIAWRAQKGCRYFNQSRITLISS